MNKVRLAKKFRQKIPQLLASKKARTSHRRGRRRPPGACGGRLPPGGWQWSCGWPGDTRNERRSSKMRGTGSIFRRRRQFGGIGQRALRPAGACASDGGGSSAYGGYCFCDLPRRRDVHLQPCYVTLSKQLNFDLC
jgi:hypothetical protein